MDPLPTSTTTERYSTLDDIIKEVDRFRILVIGRSGVGKSSLINCVFGIKNARVEDQKVGAADIEQEFVSPHNQYFVLHDSQGFEPGDLDNFDTVRKFVEGRSQKQHLKDRIHGLWLCTETPTAGGRIFETGDEKLLEFAHKNEVPLVLVFTQCDRLVRTKEFQLREAQPDLDPISRRNQGLKNAEEAFDTCLKSLKVTMDHLKIPMPTYAKVSVRKGYEKEVSNLVQVTTNVAKERVKGDAWVLWSMAQRASLPVKIDACVSKGISHYLQVLAGSIPGCGGLILRNCLEKIHKDIITCWNFKGEALTSPDFRDLMVGLVEDVRTEQIAPGAPNVDLMNQISTFAGTVSKSVVPAFGALGLTVWGARWLQVTLQQNLSEVQRLLIAYIVDLIRVLMELFNITIRVELALTTTEMELREAFEAYDKSDSRRRIHDSIRSKKPMPMMSSGEISREIRRLLKEYECQNHGQYEDDHLVNIA